MQKATVDFESLLLLYKENKLNNEEFLLCLDIKNY